MINRQTFYYFYIRTTNYFTLTIFVCDYENVYYDCNIQCYESAYSFKFLQPLFYTVMYQDINLIINIFLSLIVFNYKKTLKYRNFILFFWKIDKING